MLATPGPEDGHVAELGASHGAQHRIRNPENVGSSPTVPALNLVLLPLFVNGCLLWACRFSALDGFARALGIIMVFRRRSKHPL